MTETSKTPTAPLQGELPTGKPPGTPSAQEETGFTFRRPSYRDGPLLWRLVRDSGALDLNSPYAYLMMAHWFHDTCVIAEREGVAAGFAMGFVPPRQTDTLFIWQIAVSRTERGHGLGRRLLGALVQRDTSGIRYLEATVTPSNRASESLFRAFARSLGVPCAVSDLFPAKAFPSDAPATGKHEAERLFRIGPLISFNSEDTPHGHL